uniref:Protein transport protein sec16 n=1 Tax=Anthurium amnicola TaxID=1678845 RepID=A0A1D1YWY9_9ARAE
MASTAVFQGEDQTDEDFFDKLVGDDEFGLTGSGSADGDMARALSNLSIDDVGTSADSFEPEEQHGDQNVLVSEPQVKDSSVPEESAPVAPCNTVAFDEAGWSSDPVNAMTEVGSPGSSTEKSIGCKGTCIKEVQWSSFSSGQGQLDFSGCGSYTDFFPETPDESASQLVVGKGSENTVANLNSSFGSFETQDAQNLGVANDQSTRLISSEQSDAQAHGAFNEQVTPGNESQQWENAYPGWKYDANTGQWCQVESYDATTNVPLDGYGPAVANYQEYSQPSTELADDGFVHGQRAEISYLQQTAQSVVETVSNEYTTGNVSNWNQVSHENVDYPPNMVFDPQYPGWYYDNNTLQWYSLESYTQSLQTMAHTVQNQRSQNVGASSDGLFSDQTHTLYNNEVGQLQTQALGSQSSQEQRDQGGYSSNHYQPNVWQPVQDDRHGTTFSFSGNQTMGKNFYGSQTPEENYVDQQIGFQTAETVPNHLHGSTVGTNSFSAFVAAESSYQFSQSRTEQIQHVNISQNYYLNQNSTNYPQQFPQSENASYSQFSYTPNGGRSLEGRPPHALVTFGFGGKLIVMKDTSFGTSLAYSSQGAKNGEITVLNLSEVVTENMSSATVGNNSCDYFHTLCRQSFPGPLVGGNAAMKDLNKWIDERITSCESSTMDFRKGELLRLLLSLLKISCQHYGKLRSPFGADPSLQEADSPELAVTRLFASVRKNGDHLREYGAFTHCMHNLPSEGHIRKTSIEVQNLLVSGRRKEALQCAQEGQLWGPALVLAAQLGDKFYVDTVKQMAHRQFVSGSPLRTLCLLIAGQPADVFSTDNSNNSLTGAINMSQQPVQVSTSGMLDDWEENLAIITANRTKDDELVIIHLGDCLWKERDEVTAAHTCYLVAEANFESYSDKARLCLIGADHWKCPRTYASPEAIQVIVT